MAPTAFIRGREKRPACGSVPRAYGQSGVVANFDTERAHRGRALQWFLRDGSVLAWLPLPGKRISIVWSAPSALATELLALDAVELAARVAVAGGHELGTLTAITPAAAFELSFLKLPAVVGERLALVGDAAHGVHPLAGQGVNLGFGDAAALAAILGARGPVTDAGAPILLERYARRRAGPVLAMQLVTDGLVRLFDVRASWLRVLRNRGMRAVGAIGVAEEAAGAAGATVNCRPKEYAMAFFRFLVAIAVCALLGALSASAQTQDAAQHVDATIAPELAAVKQLIEAKFPGAAVSNVARSPYFGLYEAQFDDRMIYTDAKVSYVVVGSIFDADTKQNLTDARLRQLNRVAWDQLPLDLAIKKVKGNGARRLAIFSDADCPYCKRLESRDEDARQRDHLHLPLSYRPAPPRLRTQVGADLVRAGPRPRPGTTGSRRASFPTNKGDCATPIAKTALLGQKYRVSATPTLVFADGTMVPGAIPLDRSKPS